MKSKKYMAIKETFWKENYQEWNKNDKRYGMKPFIAYEVINRIGGNVILQNNTESYFYDVDIYEVTPKENPEYFL
jgi:hypothetical protein